MFSYIKGSVEELGEEYIVIEHNGIGFYIMSSLKVISSLKLGQSIKIHTHMNVREDDISLYGFLTKDELTCFRQLINISGVGPKVALSIMSSLDMDELRLAILSEDYKAITKANGVGQKMAQRVVMELKDKIKLEDMTNHATEIYDEQPGDDAVNETAQALTALGYSNSEALKAIKKVDDYNKLSTEQLLKEALKKML